MARVDFSYPDRRDGMMKMAYKNPVPESEHERKMSGKNRLGKLLKKKKKR